MTQKRYKILSIVGARPQFIKLAGMHNALINHPSIDHKIVHSGQHYDHQMSGQFFEELMLPAPDYNVGIGSASHNQQLAQCLIGFDEIFDKENPDLVLVYGDTNTTAAGAIASAKRNIPLGHIEAGLREFDKSIPEEVNKLITDALADLYFTPTHTGMLNLMNEGVINNVFVTGDISLDLLYNKVFERQESRAPYVFVTCHRAANTDDMHNLKEILEAINILDLDVIFTLHPRTSKAITNFGLQDLLMKENITILEPQGFWETQKWIKYATFVLTDSGGVIKEAYFHKVPAIIIDKQTEWVETVKEGWNIIVGPDKTKILNALSLWKRPESHSNCIGDGRAAERIIAEILRYLDDKK